MPFATNFLLGPDVSFRGEAEVGRAAEPAASVEDDPNATSARHSTRQFPCAKEGSAMPCSGGGNETARGHYASQRCGRWLAACSTRTADLSAGGGVPQQRIRSGVRIDGGRV